VAHARQQQRGDVAGAAGEVQYAIAFADTRRCNEVPLPQTMDAERHQVVHHVVLAGDGREHLADQLLLFGDRHFAIAEVGGRAGSVRFAHPSMVAQGREQTVSRNARMRAFTPSDGRGSRRRRGGMTLSPQKSHPPQSPFVPKGKKNRQARSAWRTRETAFPVTGCHFTRLPSASITCTSPRFSARTGFSIFERSPTITQVRCSGWITSLAAASTSASFCASIRDFRVCT